MPWPATDAKSPRKDSPSTRIVIECSAPTRTCPADPATRKSNSCAVSFHCAMEASKTPAERPSRSSNTLLPLERVNCGSESEITSPPLSAIIAVIAMPRPPDPCLMHANQWVRQACAAGIYE